MKGVKRVVFIKPNRINNEIIHVSEVRLTGIDGSQLGIHSFQEALKKAEKIGLDLVEMSPNANPPVCRIMDYGKFLYKKSKSIKEQKKKQKVIQIKEIKIRPSTEEGDYQVKLKNLCRFLEDGSKVKVTLRFRGREMAHQHIGVNVLNRIKKDVTHLVITDASPLKIEGRQIIMILIPKKK
ncbi:Translation initiation factor IF-3 [Buchnera aphidicola (Thelaxes suberi)]|uniref:translation initiation factor IF-3 n=1 Tax=Buchnera aphidicola TaxID=9 RepID=UPI00346397DF